MSGVVDRFVEPSFQAEIEEEADRDQDQGHRRREGQFHWPGHALDTALVRGSAGTVNLPYGTFKHTVLTQEQSPLEPGVIDHKWSVRGIGYVEERAASGTKEQIKLVRVTHR